MKDGRPTAIFLPGIIMPAVLRYAPLLRELGAGFDCRTKELEVYSLTPPPPTYSVEWEVEGLHDAARRAGLDSFHLYGHSGGGAVSLAFTARHPEMVQSLTLDEPAFDYTGEGRAELGAVLDLVDSLAARPEEAMPRFLRMELKAGVEFQPPSGPPPLPNRPAGVAALLRSFSTYEVDLEALRRFEGPVLFTRGTLSNERYERSSGRLAALFRRFQEVVFEGLSHLNTSHQAEPARVAALLAEHWSAPAEVSARLRGSQSDAIRAALTEEVVRQFYELFGKRELDQAVALFADDAEFHLSGTNAISGTHRGKSAILAFWRRQLELSRGTFRTRLVSMAPTDDHVVVTLALRAEVAGEPVAWGRTVDYRVADGLIAEATVVESDQALADRLFRP